MKVLVTGGTGVIGHGVLTALLERGHHVRLLSRNARHDAAEWADRVEPLPGDVSRADLVEGAAEGCQAVIHIAGILAESEEQTYESVNVNGTRLVLAEAERAGVKRFVFVSSLGADRGQSGYHQSKRRAEALVKKFRGEWVICRPGNVYGPGDEVISLVLKLVRTAPVMPVIDDGDQPFQPVWHEDVGKALALAIEKPEVVGQELDLAGPDVTSMNDLLDRLATVTGRSPARVPLPGALASLGARAAAALGIGLPVDDAQIRMLHEGNVVRGAGGNALDTVFGIAPTPLSVGLRNLADTLPAQLPSDGVGGMRRKRYWADIAKSSMTPETLFETFRTQFHRFMPIDTGAEPGTEGRVPEVGETLTMALPVRGTIQVRVEELNERDMTLSTLEGHPIAGAVRFLSEARGDDLRFEVQVFERAANLFDLIAMRTIGDILQNSNWEQLVTAVIDASGGESFEGVQYEAETLDDEQAKRIEEWLVDLIAGRKREANDPRSASRVPEVHR